VNQQTGERTPNYPGPGYAQQQGSYGAPQQGGYGYGQGGYSNQGAAQQNSYDPTRSGEQQQKQGGNGLKYAAVGVAGLAGGALLMHESDKIGRCLQLPPFSPPVKHNSNTNPQVKVSKTPSKA